MGLTPEVQEHFEKKKNTGTGAELTAGYIELFTMFDVGIPIGEYVNLHRLDRSLLKYYRMVKVYHMDKMIEQQEEETKQASESKVDPPPLETVVRPRR